MDYVQLTIDDWLSMKERLRKQLQDVSEGFVRIGYQLKQIKAQRLYERDGYKDLVSFAKAEYGLSATVVSRFMAINTRYSIDGNTEFIRPEFAGIGSSKLGEMLTIREEDMELISKETTRESIRELKRFEKDEKKTETPEISDREKILVTIVEEFFRNQKELLNHICSEDSLIPIDEWINPSGNRTFRTGIYFVSFFGLDKGIKVRAFGQNKPEAYTWEEFEHTFNELFAHYGDDTWDRHYDPASLLKKEKQQDDRKPEEITERDGGDGRHMEETPGTDIEGSEGDMLPGGGSDGASAETSDQEDRGKPDVSGAGMQEPEEVQADTIGTSPESVEHPARQEVFHKTDDEHENISPEDVEVVSEEIAPAQKNGLNSSQGDDKSYDQITSKKRVSRKKCMEMMTSVQMACYLSEHLSTTTLKNRTALASWLEDKVEI